MCQIIIDYLLLLYKPTIFSPRLTCCHVNNCDISYAILYGIRIFAILILLLLLLLLLLGKFLDLKLIY